MASYRHTRLGEEIPPIPIVPLELIKPGRFEGESIVGQGILDTGSDATLIPIPYEVGIKFDRFRHYVFRVYGCPVEDIGDMALVGRDLMNLYRIEFDGNLGIFTIG